MFGFFSLLNWLIGSVYPVVASFKAYDSYSRLATKTGATTFNVGGVSIPLGTILKKATSGDSQIEEDTVNCRLLNVQMWLIYWMVNATVLTAENVFFLTWLPFYSLMRCGLSLWLIAPILVSGARLKQPQVLSYNDMQREWASFSGQGCGYVYFRILRPFLTENIGLLSRIRLEPLLGAVSRKLVLPFAQSIGMLTLFSRNSFRLVPGPNAPEGAGMVDGEISEYDVVETPVMFEDSGLRNRELNVQEAVGLERQSWFW